jgi:hypothetical protein
MTSPRFEIGDVITLKAKPFDSYMMDPISKEYHEEVYNFYNIRPIFLEGGSRFGNSGYKFTYTPSTSKKIQFQIVDFPDENILINTHTESIFKPITFAFAKEALIQYGRIDGYSLLSNNVRLYLVKSQEGNYKQIETRTGGGYEAKPVPYLYALVSEDMFSEGLSSQSYKSLKKNPNVPDDIYNHIFEFWGGDIL